MFDHALLGTHRGIVDFMHLCMFITTFNFKKNEYFIRRGQTF